MSRIRKNSADYQQVQERFLELLAEGHPPLVIRHMMGLSQFQYEGHINTAFRGGAITADDLRPQYEAVTLKSLPPVIQSLIMKEQNADESNDFVKVVQSGANVTLTLLPTSALRLTYSGEQAELMESTPGEEVFEFEQEAQAATVLN